ncbi:CAP domain-containing protein [Halopelagius longus]|uniref:CAP domain-containing protein n=1 Tax=Halopelagius longus TaxID=1236180 RepID=UPI00215D82BC|nr:CAP domain-containing protein [Halopelagius longus]
MAVVLLASVIAMSIHLGILGYSNGRPTFDKERLDSIPAGNNSSTADVLPNVSLEIDTTHNESVLEREIHKEINERRQSHGLSPLKSDSQLSNVARSHSQDMATRDYFSHDSPEGRDFDDRYQQHGYECRVQISDREYATGGENIAYRASSGLETNESELADEIVNGWMNSTGHRENILRPYWRVEGIGVTVTSRDDMTAVYVTQNFC